MLVQSVNSTRFGGIKQPAVVPVKCKYKNFSPSPKAEIDQFVKTQTKRRNKIRVIDSIIAAGSAGTAIALGNFCNLTDLVHTAVIALSGITGISIACGLYNEFKYPLKDMKKNPDNYALLPVADSDF